MYYHLCVLVNSKGNLIIMWSLKSLNVKKINIFYLTRLFEPNVFTLSIRIWLLVFFYFSPWSLIHKLQKHWKNEVKRKTSLLYLYFYHRLDYSVTRLLSECDFSPMRGGTFGKLHCGTHIIIVLAGYWLQADRVSINALENTVNINKETKLFVRFS